MRINGTSIDTMYQRNGNMKSDIADNSSKIS